MGPAPQGNVDGNRVSDLLLHWLRAKLYFNLLRSAVLCVRGSRTTKHELNTDFSGAEIANVIGKIK